MKLFRYRRPSLTTVLGITKAKKRLKKELGITEAMKPIRLWTKHRRRFNRRIGYESEGGDFRVDCRWEDCGNGSGGVGKMT